MVCLKSAMLERRPDLPLCNLRRLRQLGLVSSSSRNTTSGNSTSRLIRELFCPKHLHQTEVDICHLLQSPVKVGPDLKVDPGVGVERDVMIPCRLTTVTIKCQEKGDELKYDDRSPFFIRREMKVYHFIYHHVVGIRNSNPHSRIPESYVRIIDMVSMTCRVIKSYSFGDGLCGGWGGESIL